MNPPPYISLLFLCFCSDGSNQHKILAAGGNLSLSGKRGGKSHLETIVLLAVSGIWRFCMVIRLLLPISMETTHDNKEPGFSDSLKDHAACYVVSFGDHVPYFRVLAPRKDVQGTVYLGAEGASLTC